MMRPDFIQRLPAESREEVLLLLDAVSRQEVTGLMAYAEDEAGGCDESALFSSTSRYVG